MKKVTYLMTILFAVALMSTSCCKDDPVPEPQTLEEQYPEWSDLSWVSTDGNDVNYAGELEDTYPRIEITINDDELTFKQWTWDVPNDVPYTEPYVNTYLKDNVVITSTNVTFSGGLTVTGDYETDGVQITLRTTGIISGNVTYEYVLQ